MAQSSSDVVSLGVLLIGEEFEDFVGARRRIDLLEIDTKGRLVVIELKRADDGGHAELQAIRYAALVSAMTLDQIVEQRERFAADRGLDEVDSRSVVLAWIGGEEMLADDVRIILVAADFGLELTTTVLWLTERHDLDITCVRAVPYQLDDRLLLNVEQVIPLPETASYQVSVRRKEAETRQAGCSQWPGLHQVPAHRRRRRPARGLQAGLRQAGSCPAGGTWSAPGRGTGGRQEPVGQRVRNICGKSVVTRLRRERWHDRSVVVRHPVPRRGSGGVVGHEASRWTRDGAGAQQAVNATSRHTELAQGRC